MTKKYVILVILINGLLPWGIYELLSPYLESIVALTIATLLPLSDNLFHMWKHKKLDAFGSLMLFTFVLTIILAALGGSEKLLLMRESFVTGSVGLVFLGSLLLGRPIMFNLAQKFLNKDVFTTNSKYSYFRFVMKLMTAVWGVVLLLESCVRVMLVFELSTAQFLAASNLILYGFIGSAILWTMWYRKRSARQLERIKLQEG